MTRRLRIGFFDSGIGGLSVLRHAPSRIANADYLYVADSAYAPYGRQSEELVRQRSHRIADFLLAKPVDAIVIACNTATALAAESIRAATDIPVVAMEPALKPAMQCSANKKVAVLATATTLASERYRCLKQEHAFDGEVYERACHHWVEAVEKGDLDDAQLQALVDAELQQLSVFGADTYILACTHFPFLARNIETGLGSGLRLIDPAAAVVEQLARRLDISPPPAAPPGPPQLTVFSSQDNQRTAQRIEDLLGWRLQVQPLPL